MGTTELHFDDAARFAVHPHARGDNRGPARCQSSNVGSPPRAWGQPPSRAARGTIAGSPPRAWGQRDVKSAATQDTRFTPTRVGTTDHGGGYWSLLRFTPTRVGTTRVACPPHPPFPVHPHARGDNANVRPARIITVHPHARGDNHGDYLAIQGDSGSPPRAWGQRTTCTSVPVRCRFTPTRVGTTVREPLYAIVPYGSPPRAWGQHVQTIEASEGNRFTPTRVGTTLGSTWSAAQASVHPHARGDRRLDGRKASGTAAVHPHARGDNCGGLASGGNTIGSPPRAWGQLTSSNVIA